MVFEVGSTSRMRSRRLSDSTISSLMRDLAADQPGIAALRHDRRAGLVGELEDCGTPRRPKPGRSTIGVRAVIEVAHLDQIGRLRLRIGDGVFLADDGGEARQQRRIGRGRRLVGIGVRPFRGRIGRFQ